MLANLSPYKLEQLKVVVLTGAGISAESGLKTFRDNNGLWEEHSIEDVATPEGFERNADLVYRFYNQRRRQLLSPEVHPNKAHLALAKLENALANNFTLITQNVDDLHQRAGNKNVLHMHGSLISARCLTSGSCSAIFDDLDHTNQCDCCYPSSNMRPDIVWFGEMPKYMQEIETLLYAADVFVSIGTSGTVYPAAGFVSQANHYGAYSVELNLEPSSGQNKFSENHYGPASQLVVQFVNTLLKGHNFD
ncbi:Sir2 family NAD+-dependent deacetylase [Paraglaciecola psychrophila]|uniref:NAD-dependent protein deacylase n=1 Tax=Paraglaciecola psychrophila 170 TaxID=1129794 RepID=K7A673_9ALTE|nr:Sir2 family NAD+-dependent deacetylase [Paraglaciecola psychrophila]AGH44945.1 silent information regulator protein Sir2 [Paraglaciecola psychrophila 170]GAC36298.1 NAD-dependent deacetylase [Paraglaciecola psychrophila 170]